LNILHTHLPSGKLVASDGYGQFIPPQVRKTVRIDTGAPSSINPGNAPRISVPSTPSTLGKSSFKRQKVPVSQPLSGLESLVAKLNSLSQHSPKIISNSPPPRQASTEEPLFLGSDREKSVSPPPPPPPPPLPPVDQTPVPPLSITPVPPVSSPITPSPSSPTFDASHTFDSAPSLPQSPSSPTMEPTYRQRQLILKMHEKAYSPTDIQRAFLKHANSQLSLSTIQSILFLHQTSKDLHLRSRSTSTTPLRVTPDIKKESPLPETFGVANFLSGDGISTEQQLSMLRHLQEKLPDVIGAVEQKLQEEMEKKEREAEIERQLKEKEEQIERLLRERDDLMRLRGYSLC
jgi:hypothetical protein